MSFGLDVFSIIGTALGLLALAHTLYFKLHLPQEKIRGLLDSIASAKEFYQPLEDQGHDLRRRTADKNEMNLMLRAPTGTAR
ncbi:hypothetical protein EVG20_g4766 [Dentipellis fragilis]|uniref:Uncharacterized protein n=1 Tax=Dentipellis fragilis TaxID=205917 RepID=A0A4Y9YXG5_9AGAM|nr:hypothetical protein EVG20_g4766 [Dentipellis fragilis]